MIGKTFQKSCYEGNILEVISRVIRCIGSMAAKTSKLLGEVKFLLKLYTEILTEVLLGYSTGTKESPQNQ